MVTLVWNNPAAKPAKIQSWHVHYAFHHVNGTVDCGSPMVQVIAANEELQVSATIAAKDMATSVQNSSPCCGSLRTLTISIVAVAANGRVSSHSSPAVVEGFDLRLPTASFLPTLCTLIQGGAAALICYKTDGITAAVQIQRQPKGATGLWRPVSAWMPVTVNTFVDSPRQLGAEFAYRMLCRANAGQIAVADGTIVL